jgi:hypothetical protein
LLEYVFTSKFNTKGAALEETENNRLFEISRTF